MEYLESLTTWVQKSYLPPNYVCMFCAKPLDNELDGWSPGFKPDYLAVYVKGLGPGYTCLSCDGEGYHDVCQVCDEPAPSTEHQKVPYAVGIRCDQCNTWVCRKCGSSKQQKCYSCLGV